MVFKIKYFRMGKNKKNRGGKGKGAKKKKGVSLPPSHYINKQQNQDCLTYHGTIF